MHTVTCREYRTSQKDKEELYIVHMYIPRKARLDRTLKNIFLVINKVNITFFPESFFSDFCVNGGALSSPFSFEI